MVDLTLSIRDRDIKRIEAAFCHEYGYTDLTMSKAPARFERFLRDLLLAGLRDRENYLADSANASF